MFTIKKMLFSLFMGLSGILFLISAGACIFFVIFNLDFPAIVSAVVALTSGFCCILLYDGRQHAQANSSCSGYAMQDFANLV